MRKGREEAAVVCRGRWEPGTGGQAKKKKKIRSQKDQLGRKWDRFTVAFSHRGTG